ncbi:sulfatase family protein [Aeoliella sp.]|uniref:sulfatase family protein n=1 Tax=Aeoliella sp. TaxID=2795800 RepID=UPI003CCBE2A4
MIRCLLALSLLVAGATAYAETPNIVVIFIDDMGYADIGPFGAEDYTTPNLDRMAAEGMVLTDFHSSTAVCSASRASLLTGCYSTRVSILGALGPNSKVGLNPDEITIAELCKSKGYATAVFGKWHLGDEEPFLPTNQGFDEWFGLPYSNDMWPLHPDLVRLPPNAERRKRGYPPLPLYEGTKVVDEEVTAEDQEQLTTQYTEHAVDFIRRNREQPFFLYVPHSMVHVPLFVSDKFKDKSGAGLYGDVVMEVDWSVGQILEALKQEGLDENTLVMFTSDNGPWLSYGSHAGSAGPLREGKATMFEGGYRVPCVARWPGKIKPGTKCDELAGTIDLLPTIAGLIGAEVPTDRQIDGKDIWPLLSGAPDAESPHDYYYCYWQRELQAIRDPQWKLHFPHSFPSLEGREGGQDGMPVRYSPSKIGLELFDLQNDPGETTNVFDDHPEVVARLQAAAEKAREDLGDALQQKKGSGVRPPGRLKQQPTR